MYLHGSFDPIAAPGAEQQQQGHADDATSARSEVFPVYGNTSEFNINKLLYNNIMQCDYFKALYQLRTYHETIDEIYNSVTHVGPWQTGTTRNPSTAFCLLLKFMLMRLTRKQLRGLLDTGDSPFVRSIGLLFLRYCCAPKDLWSYYEPFLESTEEFTPSPDQALKMTIGEFCVKLLTDMQYFGTTLPRIPVPIERKIKVMLLLLKERQKRRAANSRLRDEGKVVKGSKVQAIYGDEQSEPAWYEAVIDRKATSEEVIDLGKAAAADELLNCFYWVTFPEYGNTEIVDLGDIKLTEAEDAPRHESSSHSHRGGGGSSGRRSSRSRSTSRDSRDRTKRRRSRSRSRDRSGESSRDLMAEVLKSEREASAAVGKNYAHRVASYKGSLSLQADRYTVRKKSRSRSPVHHSSSSSHRSGKERRRSRTPPRASQHGTTAAAAHREPSHDRRND